MAEDNDSETVSLEVLRQRLETTRASLDEWLFLCRSVDRAHGRIDCDKALLVLLAVRLRQRGVRRPTVSRAIAELLQGSDHPASRPAGLPGSLTLD